MSIQDKYILMESPAYSMLQNIYCCTIIVYYILQRSSRQSVLRFPVFKLSRFEACPEQPEPQNFGFWFSIFPDPMPASTLKQALLSVRD